MQKESKPGFVRRILKQFFGRPGSQTQTPPVEEPDMPEPMDEAAETTFGMEQDYPVESPRPTAMEPHQKTGPNAQEMFEAVDRWREQIVQSLNQLSEIPSAVRAAVTEAMSKMPAGSVPSETVEELRDALRELGDTSRETGDRTRELADRSQESLSALKDMGGEAKRHTELMQSLRGEMSAGNEAAARAGEAWGRIAQTLDRIDQVNREQAEAARQVRQQAEEDRKELADRVGKEVHRLHQLLLIVAGLLAAGVIVAIIAAIAG